MLFQWIIAFSAIILPIGIEEVAAGDGALNTWSILAVSPNKKSCTISLGQLAKHNRLNRTIPHKAFESAFLSTPYLTAGNRGISELFADGVEIACFSPGNSLALVDGIRNLFSDHDKLNEMSSLIHKKYHNICNQEMLSRDFLKIVIT